MRFIHNTNSKNPKMLGPLITLEIKSIEQYWIKHIQKISFKVAIKALKEAKKKSLD